jgi:hypothetical protein
MSARVELGCAGHFICHDACLWRRHTQVGRYRISSVGEFQPKGRGRQPIGSGAGDFFETMVFETSDKPNPLSNGCGCMIVPSFSEIDSARYATAGEAQAGHERFVRKYLRKAVGK